MDLQAPREARNPALHGQDHEAAQWFGMPAAPRVATSCDAAAGSTNGGVGFPLRGRSLRRLRLRVLSVRHNLYHVNQCRNGRYRGRSAHRNLDGMSARGRRPGYYSRRALHNPRSPGRIARNGEEMAASRASLRAVRSVPGAGGTTKVCGGKADAGCGGRGGGLLRARSEV